MVLQSIWEINNENNIDEPIRTFRLTNRMKYCRVKETWFRECLDMLDVAGCIVMGDAMTCQKEIAKKIINGKADYVLALKENQPLLYRETEEYLQAAVNDSRNYPEIQKTETKEKGHGRL